ncbi:glycosyltransferase [Vibrio salinus]|uniref:glycosyltransferase n=1 Tax=Vibrio salinus TaxID=2899784 RepID=UPI001E4A2C8A|nr:glycosyltransferase [Vibrio salinus]MCE0493269.1 glycosyltransferase [Vibrio salinus]
MEKKICVCHVVYCYDVGGLERIVANCINNLNSKKYHHVIISLTKIGDFFSEISVPAEHYSLHKKPGNDFSVHVRLYKLLKQLKPDVMHSYNLGTIEYQWVAFLAGVPLRVHAEHGRDSYDPDGTVKKYQLIRRLCSLVIHRFVAVSDDLKKWLSDDVGIPEKKLRLIVNGIDTHYFDPENTEDSARDNLKNSHFVFGHVARLHKIKNQIFLLKAFSQACMERTDFAQNCVLWIVGDGPDRACLEQFVFDNSVLRKRVKFVGSKTNVKDYYQQFDVFTMSSVAEGIPMTLLESMSMSVPHIVTRVGGINEVIIDRETGLSVNSEDLSGFMKGMLEIYTDSDSRYKMSIMARKRVQSKFSQDTMISSYEKIYSGEA